MSGVTTLVSPLLADAAGVRHAFFTRQGGVSEGVYASLNVGRGSGDDLELVIENRARAAALFGRAETDLATAYQMHSPRAVVAEAAWPAGGAPQADAVATLRPGLICGALAADCAPVLIADPRARVVAAVHAGWRGALGGVIKAAVEAMEGLGARRRSMLAAVGPCIGPRSYEVGLEFLQTFEAAAADNARFFAPGASPEKRLFDLPAFALARLAAAGVTRAEWTGHDTYADAGLFFSNRRAVHRGERDYGRLLSAIMLEP
ncbi:MAG: peptidoglycan editing factor PgeF [Caulobacterales bacterium]